MQSAVHQFNARESKARQSESKQSEAKQSEAGQSCARQSEATQLEASQPEAQPSHARPVRAVVIDDSPVFLRSLCSFLRELEDVQIVGAAENAEDGFRLVEQSHPGLVLIDLQMPGMNGLEATALLRRRHPDTRVIMVTMHDTPELRQASLEGGAHGFVSKSRLSQDLPGVLQKILAA